MNKGVLVLVASVMTVAMLAGPVFAIGPQNAENNPNVEILRYGVGLATPSGVHQEWVLGIGKHLMMKDAGNFKINNAFVVTDISQVSEMENKWLFFSVPMFAEWMHFVLPQMPYSFWLKWVTQNYPEGVYYREVLVGK